MRTIENVPVLEQIGLEREDLLSAQRKLLIPGPRQTERLVPRRKLHGARQRADLAERHAERLEHDADDVVFGLRLGQPERVDLDAVSGSV